MARTFIATNASTLFIDAAVAQVPPFTVCAWFRPTDVTHVGVLFFLGDKDTSTTQHYRLHMNGPGAGSPLQFGVAAAGSLVQATTLNGCTVNTWHMATAIAATTSSRTVILDANVASQGTETSLRAPGGLDRTALGLRHNSGGGAAFNGRMAWVTVWNQVLTANELTALYSGRNPLTIRRPSILTCWPLFGWATPEPNLISGAGALGPTANPPTLTLNGPPVEPMASRLWTLPLAAVVSGISGTLDQSLAVLTSTSSGSVPTSGALSHTLAALTSASSGVVSTTGALTQPLGALMSSSASTVAVAGSAAPPLAALTATSAGTVVSGLAGSLTQTLAALVATSSAQAPVTGTSTPTLAILTSSSTGVLPVTCSTTRTLGAVLLTATGGAPGAVGSTSLPLGALTSTSTAQAAVQGSSAKTLGPLTHLSTGTVAVQGTAAVPLGALTSSSTGQVPTTGTASLFLGALAVSSTSQALVLGATIQTLDPLDGVASGVIDTVISAGSVQATLQACSLVAQGGYRARGRWI